MNKTALSIMMVVYLYNRDLVKKSELAEYLEVSERKIIDLRTELEVAGIDIETIPGKNGGYRLNSKSTVLSALSLSDEEFNALFMAREQLKSDNFIYQKTLNQLIEKVEATHHAKDSHTNYQFIKSLKRNRMITKEKEWFKRIKKAIDEQNKVIIYYKNSKAEIKKYYANPYDLFYYKGFWYMISYNAKYNKGYNYKLVRIQDIEILSQQFERHANFKLQNFVGETSIFSDEEYQIKLHIEPPLSVIVSEMVIAKNQEILELEDGSIIFDGKMEGKLEIISWLLSLGSSVNVLEPQVIKRAYESEVKRLIDKYTTH
ncbi:helix-turn-helix transcriptional regulator [Haloplasma contractile]|uniref:DeoR-family transcriptional regulator protein n=1 Tax=Haloplasma contractile SSD-17B TaxID=1033810 RepID=U2EFL3_9MOLU|nr:WYL domain-containing protein [Haloplasma contractile]ERJ13723.1 DeoR-family transcriptional regulator protein [Haloplasma contractile SSD-17B]